MTAQQVTQSDGMSKPGDFVVWGFYTGDREAERKMLLPLDHADYADVLVGWTIAKPYGTDQYEPRPVNYRIKPVRKYRTVTGWRVYSDGGDFVKAGKTIPEAAEKAVVIGIDRGYDQTIEEATAHAQKANMDADAAKKARDLARADRIARGRLVDFKGDRYEGMRIESNNSNQVIITKGRDAMYLSPAEADALADALRKVAAAARLDATA